MQPKAISLHFYAYNQIKITGQTITEFIGHWIGGNMVWTHDVDRRSKCKLIAFIIAYRDAMVELVCDLSETVCVCAAQKLDSAEMQSEALAIIKV